jgi:predicted nucleic acid-binding protein
VPGADAPIVVDTNVIFSALLRTDATHARIILRSGRRFFICESVLVELYRHKERILRFSRMTDDEIVVQLHELLRRMQVYNEDVLPLHHVDTAADLCRDVDPADAPMVALALTLDAWLRTGDRKLRSALESRGFTSFFDPPLSLIVPSE